MAITIEQVEGYMNNMGLRFKRVDNGTIVFGMRMRTYRDPDGEEGLKLVIRLRENGEYFEIFAPKAFNAVGPHVDAFLKACMMIHWRTKLIQFEYDASDGEIRPIIEFPLEDGTLTEKQLERCIGGICGLLDEYYPVLRKALDEGVVEFPDEIAGLPQVAAEGLIEALLARVPPDKLQEILARLTSGGRGSRQDSSDPKPPTEL